MPEVRHDALEVNTEIYLSRETGLDASIDLLYSRFSERATTTSAFCLHGEPNIASRVTRYAAREAHSLTSLRPCGSRAHEVNGTGRLLHLSCSSVIFIHTDVNADQSLFHFAFAIIPLLNIQHVPIKSTGLQAGP